MKRAFFKLLSKMNRAVLPSFTKQKLDLARAGKFQKLILGWKLWVTKNSIKQ